MLPSPAFPCLPSPAVLAALPALLAFCALAALAGCRDGGTEAPPDPGPADSIPAVTGLRALPDGQGMIRVSWRKTAYPGASAYLLYREPADSAASDAPYRSVADTVFADTVYGEAAGRYPLRDTAVHPIRYRVRILGPDNRIGPDSGSVVGTAVPPSLSGGSGPWKMALARAPFPGRLRGSLVAFGDRLWLLGGESGDTALHDAWSTGDGIAWEKEIDSLPFGPVVDSRVIVHRDELWALTTRAAADGFENDVWTSADGVSWTRVSENAVAFRWGGNRGSAFASFGDRLWSVWGAPLPGSGESTIQASADGKAWRFASGAPLSGCLQHAGAAVLGDALWILGGDAKPYADFYSDQTWRTDGAAWTNVPSDTNVLPRYGFALAAHAGRLWSIGGAATAAPYEPDGARADEVWSSGDGMEWSLADAHAAFGKRVGAAVASFRGRLWMVGGARMADGAIAPGPLNDVWYREEAP